MGQWKTTHQLHSGVLMKVGDLVRYSQRPNHFIGIIIKSEKESWRTFYHVYWLSEYTSAWVTRRDLELVNESNDTCKKHESIV